MDPPGLADVDQLRGVLLEVDPVDPDIAEPPGARERAGLPRGTGPWAVVTSWALYDFEESSHRMRLRAIAPFVTLEQVLAEMSFEPLVADPLEILDPPTEAELRIFRTEMDPSGQFSDAGGRWAFREGDRWTLAT